MASRIENHVIGARMEYHFEHHVLPTIPYRGLRQLHRHLTSSDFFVRHREVLSDGYVVFLARAVTGKFDSDGSSQRN